MKKCPFCAEEIQEAAAVCKHCGRDVKGGARGAVRVANKKQTGCLAGGALVVILLCGAGWIASMFTRPASQPPGVSGASAAPRSTPAHTPAPTGKWTVQESTSAMDDSKSVVISLEAENDIQGWLSSARPHLVARCQENKTEVYVVVGVTPSTLYGELYKSELIVRYGQDMAVRVVGSKSTDNKGVFLPNPHMNCRALAANDTLLVRFTPFNGSPQEIHFDTRGFDKLIGKLQSTCGWK